MRNIKDSAFSQGEHITAFIAYTVLIVFALLILLPLAYIGIMSVSHLDKASYNLFSFIQQPNFDNYAKAWVKGRIPLYFYNTVFVAFFTVLLVVIAASLCGYAFRRYQYKSVQIFYYILMSALFVPVQAIILPLFLTLKTFHLLNNLWGLVFIYAGVTLALTMMLFTGFFKSIPRELDESSYLDGCGPYRTFFMIILPLSKTIIATSSILATLRVWRDFFIPLVVTTKPDKRTLSVGLFAFVDEFSVDWTPMCAAMMLQVIPVVLLFLLLQRYFISGVVSGAVKG